MVAEVILNSFARPKPVYLLYHRYTEKFILLFFGSDLLNIVQRRCLLFVQRLMASEEVDDHGNDIDDDWYVHGRNPFRHNNPSRQSYSGE